MNVILWCNRAIRWSFYLLFILVPLILTPINYELFEYNKMMVTYALTVIIAGAWVVKMIHEREVKVAKTPLDIPIALFVGSQLVSTFLSMDPHVSWWGYYSRFNGGMWSVISYVFLYYAFVTNFRSPEGKIPLTPLRVSLATAAIVALYGVAERLGVDKKIWVQDVQTRVFSTLGQPNWLAAYLVALTPIAMAFALKKMLNGQWPMLNTIKKMKYLAFSIWHLALVILFFLVLLFTRSRSGFLGLAVADILFWALTILTKQSDQSRKITIQFAAILHILFALIVFFNGSSVEQIDRFTLGGIRDALLKKQVQHVQPKTAYTGPALEAGGTESGTIRKYVWEAAVIAWRSSTKTFLIGTGTETFAFAFYQFRPAAHNLTSEWDFLYNKAHNEYLNYLATTGLIGLGTYLLMLGAFVVWFIKRQCVNASMRQSQNADASDASDRLTLALFSGWLSILITNFFGFSVVITQIFLFLFPAIMFITTAKQYVKKLSPINQITWGTITIVLAIILLGILVIRWYADTLYAKSYQLARSGQYATAKSLIDQAIVLNPQEPVYHDERATTLAALAVGALDQQEATIGGQLAQQALSENDRSIQISPQNVNFWKTRTKIYYSFSVYDPKFTQAAIEALLHAQLLSPNDPKILYNLAILNGRIGENNKAIDYLKKSIQLKTNYRDSYYALYVFYTELKDVASARNILQTYLQTIDGSDKQFNDLVAKMY